MTKDFEVTFFTPSEIVEREKLLVDDEINSIL